MFFSSDYNINAMSSFIKQAKLASLEEDSVYGNRLRRSLMIVNSMNNHPVPWSERCRFNIEWIGDSFMNSLMQYRSDSLDALDDIYTGAYRFLCEHDFFIGAGKELSMELRSLKSEIANDATSRESEVSSQIIYASYVMPASLAKQFVNHKGIGDVEQYNQTFEEAKLLKATWDKELATKKKEVEKLSSQLDNLQSGYNFVGLHEGFSDLATKKDSERKLLLKSLIAMGASVLLMPIIYYVVRGFFVGESMSLSWSHALSIVPLLSFEILMLYFFRIVLHNYNAVKTQIVQIELRKTLCRFIQKYAEYSATIKKDDSAALEKFENLIFSGILSNSDKLPTTFDGMEQIGALLKSIRAK